MTGSVDLLLLIAIMLDLYMIGASRLRGCIRATAIQGAVLALLPVGLWWDGSLTHPGHVAVVAAGSFAIKAICIPWLLTRAMRRANVGREVERFVSLHVSLLCGAALVGASFWMASVLPLPSASPSDLLVPTAFATMLLGFLVLVSRRKAVTQVLGYLMIENGVYIFGQLLVRDLPFVVELGILLDLLVGIFVMGIAIHNISREFDNIDTELLASLRD